MIQFSRNIDEIINFALYIYMILYAILSRTYMHIYIYEKEKIKAKIQSLYFFPSCHI